MRGTIFPVQALASAGSDAVRMTRRLLLVRPLAFRPRSPHQAPPGRPGLRMTKLEEVVTFRATRCPQFAVLAWQAQDYQCQSRHLRGKALALKSGDGSS